MTGKREQPGSNDEFNVGGLGTASVRRNGLAHERECPESCVSGVI